MDIFLLQMLVCLLLRTIYSKNAYHIVENSIEIKEIFEINDLFISLETLNKTAHNLMILSKDFEDKNMYLSTFKALQIRTIRLHNDLEILGFEKQQHNFTLSSHSKHNIYKRDTLIDLSP